MTGMGTRCQHSDRD